MYSNLTPEHLRKIFNYDPITGTLLRLPGNKPVNLNAKGGQRNRATLEIGGRLYAARRVIWAYMTGEWPSTGPHIVRSWSGGPYDLRWENLYRLKEGEHFCSKCKQILGQDNFMQVKAKKGGYRCYGLCKPCTNEVKREHARQNKGYAHKYIVQKYGLTEEDYAQMLTNQDGKCAICKTPPNNSRRLAVDHCHKTGVVRGLLCGPCNVSLGQFKDSPRILVDAAKYLLASRKET